jgi:Protein of unknown function (DUF3102)
MSTIREVSTQPGSPLANHAEKIRDLIKRTGSNIVEIGNLLIECKKIAGHGHWLPWLEQEFGWKERTAQRYMRIAHAVESNPSGLADLDLPMEGLYLFTAPSTPEAVRKEIITRAEKGEKITVAEVKDKINAAKEPRRPRKIGGPDHGDCDRDAPAGTARETQAQLAQDVGESSRSELARLRARSEELEHEVHRLKTKVLALEDQLAQQRQPACDLTPLQLQAQIEKLGLPRFKKEVLPPGWIPSLTNTAISLAGSEQLIATLEHKIPSAKKAARKHLSALKGIIATNGAKALH